MNYKKLFLLIVVIELFSFKPLDKNVFSFCYPKKKGTDISFVAGHFREFEKQWRGTDYFYFDAGDGFTCSVLYYKLNDDEKIELIDEPKAEIKGPDKSPAYAYSYFKSTSKLKSTEENDSSWGKPTDDFMFRQNDIFYKGTNFSLKHMYGYAMIQDDLFVNIHLSKRDCSPYDSTEMIAILNSLKIMK